MSHQITTEVEDSHILSNYEQSLDDLQNGRTNTYGSAEELFEKMGI